MWVTRALCAASVALWVTLSGGGCEPSSAARNASPKGGPPAPTDNELADALPRHGAPLVRVGSVLWLARERALWRIPLPLGSAAPRSLLLDGTIVALASDAAGHLLVTLAAPGALVRLDERGTEVGRVPIAAARGFSVTSDGERALVATGAGEIVAVELATMRRAWSAPVGSHARDVVLDEEGRAWVAGAVGVSRVEGLQGEPQVTRQLEGALAPLFVRLSGGGWGVAHGALEGSTAAARAAGLTHAVSPVPLPRHARTAYTAGRTALLATDEAVLALDAALGVVSQRSTRAQGVACDAPRGLALSADARTAFVACGDGAVAAVGLFGAETVARVTLEARDGCEGVKVGPVAHEHLDTFGDAEQIHGWLRRYHCTHRDLTDLVEIGRTHQDRPILALFIGRGPRLGHDRPVFFINGAHHGSELMSSTFALDVIDQLLEHRHPAVPRWLKEDVVFVVVPLVNPDGNMASLRDKHLGRKNGLDGDGDGVREATEGVDLNRNYPFRWGALGEMASSSDIHSRYHRGPQPGSEPETRAIMRLAESERFVASISFHTGTLAVLAPYTIPLVKDPSPNEAWVVAEHIAKQMVGHPEGLVPVRKNLYPVDGTDQDWLRHEHGTLALLVEGAKHWRVKPDEKAKIVRSVRYAWTKLVDRYLEGAAVGGRVLDVMGRPLEAEIAFEEIYRPEKERWTSRCRDGRFDRYLSKGGQYTLVATLGGHRTTRSVVVRSDKRTRLDVTLPVLVVEPAVCPTLAGGESREALVIGVDDAK